MVQKTPFSKSLADHHISANLIDVDLYRIHGGMAVETDYIIRVERKDGKGDDIDSAFESFILSKTFHHFRTFAKQLKSIADNAMAPRQRKGYTADESTKKLGRYCAAVHHLIQSQSHQYIGKVNYKYVKVLAKKRSHIIQEILDATLSHYPTNPDASQFSFEVSHAIETLFLTDHCVEMEGPPSDEQKNYTNEFGFLGNKITIDTAKEFFKTPVKKAIDGKPMATPSTPVVPISQKRRSSLVDRRTDLEELIEVGQDANLLLDDERPQSELVPSYSSPVPTFNASGSKISIMFERNPIVFAIMTVGLMVFLKRVATIEVTLDLDIFMLFIWAAFCVGLHSPRPMIAGIDKNFGPPPTPSEASDVHGRKLLRKMSMQMTPKASERSRMDSVGSLADDLNGDDGSDVMDDIQSPLPVYPKGAALGAHFNCWSQPPCENFYVRGPKYLKNRVKIESGDFLFPTRGADLFLTDTPPVNVGRIAGIMGGQLRDVPTFVINFRLPWGVMVSYFEIPERFIPFVKAGHDPDFDKSTLESTASMTPSERCLARYCQSSSEEKDRLLKIVPGVADGPWVVKSVVGNKPAILGTKMPVSYIYEKEEDGKAMYLEMDLDIVASQAARGILSVARTYTNVLTMDLGFVVQGNTEDELPEQMLAALRLHGIDPLSAPALPVSQEHILSNLEAAVSDDEDE